MGGYVLPTDAYQRRDEVQFSTSGSRTSGTPAGSTAPSTTP
jgi:hypothetical protein